RGGRLVTLLAGIAYALVLGSIVGLLYAAWYASDVVRDRRLPWIAFASVFLIPGAFILITLMAEVLTSNGPLGTLRATEGALRTLVMTAPFAAIVFLIARKGRAPRQRA